MIENKTSLHTNNVFEQPWWLDTVAPNTWKEILVKENNEIIARWPFVSKGNYVLMPKLTQTLGFWISDKIIDSDPYFNKRKKIINLLLKQLPKNKSIKIYLDHKIDYFLPLYWNNFVISPHISYRINDLNDIDSIFRRFNYNVRKHINKVSKCIVIRTIDDIELLLTLMERTFKMQNRKYPVSKNLVRNIYSSCKERQACKLLYAYDKNENLHAGSLFVYDKNVYYHLIQGSDPQYRSSGANSLLIWEGIKHASSVSKSFDFEGSMIEGIENFFRQFGGTPTVYYQIRKQNILFEVFEVLKIRIKKLIRFK